MTAGRAGGASSAPPLEVAALSAGETRAVGRRLASLLTGGDVVVLSGELGAGKTTFAQGIGAGLGVRGDVTSPTFVISRVHPSSGGGPALVHVDAYRLHGSAELDDLDLDETLEQAVTVVEWGDGLAETLSENRVRVHLSRRRTRDGDDEGPALATADLDTDDEPREITLEGVGPRWAGVPLHQVAAEGRGEARP
ncbi:MAG: tRNA threonylcarbamoyladenosine biosynthesis protein TsaE [Nocardioidaceae bacterium]|jgi:tRNA threonylcarbamoyladenosine biosynthesis protein TsaE|nr:tRNA threonylcarbamoyladenosine biosynthesis protein TsaE [Nocardioidaceae bacterium]